MLLGRHRLAGQSGLVDEQVLGFEQAQIGRNHVAGGQPHDIARHERLDRDFGRIGVARSDSALRLTLAVVCTMARSCAAASFDRCSWTKAV